MDFKINKDIVREDVDYSIPSDAVRKFGDEIGDRILDIVNDGINDGYTFDEIKLSIIRATDWASTVMSYQLRNEQKRLIWRRIKSNKENE